MYQGNIDIEVQIKYNGECFSVAEFEDFAKNGFKYPDEDDYWDYDPDEEVEILNL